MQFTIDLRTVVIGGIYQNNFRLTLQFIANWSVSELRETRLWLTKMFIGDREIILCIDETGDKKKRSARAEVASA